jgi:molybdopterin synthase catalytic subunit
VPLMSNRLEVKVVVLMLSMNNQSEGKELALTHLTSSLSVEKEEGIVHSTNNRSEVKEVILMHLMSSLSVGKEEVIVLSMSSQ